MSFFKTKCMLLFILFTSVVNVSLADPVKTAKNKEYDFCVPVSLYSILKFVNDQHRSLLSKVDCLIELNKMDNKKVVKFISIKFKFFDKDKYYHTGRFCDKKSFDSFKQKVKGERLVLFEYNNGDIPQYEWVYKRGYAIIKNSHVKIVKEFYSYSEQTGLCAIWAPEMTSSKSDKATLAKITNNIPKISDVGVKIFNDSSFFTVKEDVSIEFIEFATNNYSISLNLLLANANRMLKKGKKDFNEFCLQRRAVIEKYKNRPDYLGQFRWKYLLDQVQQNPEVKLYFYKQTKSISPNISYEELGFVGFKDKIKILKCPIRKSYTQLKKHLD